MLQIACTTRAYQFQLSSREETVRWATNLVTLALEAGCAVPGTMVLPPDADEGAEPDVVAESASAEVVASAA